MTVFIFVASLLGAMALGMPLAFSLLVSGVALMLHLDTFDTQIVSQNLINGADNFPLMAVPFFMLAGELMNAGGMSRRIVNSAMVWVGHFRGGLGYVAVFAAIIMASLSGSAVADTAALAAVLMPMMRKAGYRMDRSAGLIAAGGISSHADILRLQALGAAAVQLGTAFAVTLECDADPAFKQVLAEAGPQDMVEFISVAGLPARAVRTPWLNKYLRIESKLQAHAHEKKKCNMSFDCLSHCGLRDGNPAMGQFCIDQQLGHAMAGETDKGLFFRGAGALPFGREIRSVEALMEHLITGRQPAPHALHTIT